jgi:hypothetical protein
MKRLKPEFTFTTCLVVLGVFITVFFSIAHAGQYESLSPLLVDLKGWQAEPAQGMDMDMGGTKIIQAVRKYTRNASKADAMVMVGNSMMTQALGMQSMQMETAEAKVKVSTIDGYQVSTHHSKTDNEGAVIVSFSGTGQLGALFVFHYKGLDEKEGLSTAKKFDWKKMERQAKNLLQ